MALDLGSLTDHLTNKVGPLPAWAWAAIPAGAYVAYAYYKNSQEPVYVNDPADDPLDTTDTSAYGINNGGSYLPSYGAAPDGTSNLPNPTTPSDTNEAWFRRASNFLIDEGYTPSDVVTALNAYLYGAPTHINAKQMEILQRALIKFGPAPDPAFVPTQDTPPTTTPPSAVPDMPTDVHLIASGVSLTASWNTPQTPNGTIIGYKVVLNIYNPTTKKYQGYASTTTLGNVRSHKFDKVAAGRTYQVLITARNSKGYGAAAGTTVSVPAAGGTGGQPSTSRPPDAPTTVSVQQVAGTPMALLIAWGAPQLNGGSAIIGYKVVLNVYNTTTKKYQGVSSTTTLANGRNYKFGNLSKGHTYQALVYARNAKGYGPAAGKTIVVPK